jgi:hypothetical protein
MLRNGFALGSSALSLRRLRTLLLKEKQHAEERGGAEGLRAGSSAARSSLKAILSF